MQLLIVSYPSFTINIENSVTVNELKEQINQNNNIPLDEQSLYYAGKLLNDQKLLQDYGIEQNSFIFLNKKLLGGTRDGFPDIGHLIILFLISVVMLFSVFYFFFIMLETIVHKTQKVCATMLVDECPSISNFESITGKYKKKIPLKGGKAVIDYLSIFENDKKISGYLYFGSAVFYSAIITLSFTIYLYIYWCSDFELSTQPLFWSGVSLLTLFIGFILLYDIEKYNFLKPFKELTKFIMGTSFLGWSIFLMIVLLATKLEPLSLFYPFGIVIAFPIAYWIYKSNWSKLIKIVGYGLLFALGILLPFIGGFIQNVYIHCR